MCSTSEFDNISCGTIEFNPDTKLSQGCLNDFDKICESEMAVVVDDQEQEPNIPVIDFEKEVFDLDCYSYNQILVTSNVDTNFSSVTASSSSPEDLTTKLETIRRNFVGNIYELDQIDVDGIYELDIKGRKISEHTCIILKRQLKSSLKPIRIVLIGEPTCDAGGPLREFFTLYFDAAARNIMQGTSNSFTLLHDVKKLNNGDFERFGLLIALALMYGCSGPRNMRESLVCAFLDLPIDDGNIEDIQDFDIQTKLQELSTCADADTFQNVLDEFRERYTMGVTAPFLHLSTNKETVIKNIIHQCVSSCLVEIRSVQKGMSTLRVSIVLFFSVSQFFFIAFRTITTVTWSHVSLLAHLFLQIKLP